MDKILVLDFGGQYCHLISRRIRDAGVCTEIAPSDIPAANIVSDKEIKGVILSGGARSVYEKGAPEFDKRILSIPLPILGICYGHQLIAHHLGGEVVLGSAGEYGVTALTVRERKGILSGFSSQEKVWMNHKDVVTKLPQGFSALADTKLSQVAAFANSKGSIFGVQFHPEVTHTKNGQKILKAFALNICHCERLWSSKSLAENIVEEARQVIRDKKAILGLSGGIDSSTAAVLSSKAIGKNLTAVYVDTGFMRRGETNFLRKTFAKYRLNLKIVNASKRFFTALKGVTEPEKKRKVIGKLFADVFLEVARREKAEFLIQGTIYSDRIESGITRHSSRIKSHHNVGGLPKNLKLKLYEPLKDLYKDEVRKIAKTIGLPEEITTRQVFPGPGLAIRIIGEATQKRANIVRQATYIIEEELRNTPYWKNIWMSFSVLLPIKSVGIQGDKRSYKYPIVLRIIESKDAMTANFSKIPFEILERISTRITNEVQEVNRVVYDITNKPPGTMEWE